MAIRAWRWYQGGNAIDQFQGREVQLVHPGTALITNRLVLQRRAWWNDFLGVAYGTQPYTHTVFTQLLKASRQTTKSPNR